MKHINKGLLALFVLFILAGCKNNSSVINCPNLAMRSKAQKQFWAKSSTNHGNLIGRQGKTVQPITAAKADTNLLASTENGIPLKIKLPAGLDKKLNEGDEFEQVNKIFDAGSGGQVKLVRNSKGHAVFTASSLNSVIKLLKNMGSRPVSSPPPGPGGAFAIAGGVLGIVGFLLALGPYVGYASFLFCILAIIFGAIGLFSSRHGWAVAGIVLGVVGLVIAAALTGVYVVILHF